MAKVLIAGFGDIGQRLAGILTAAGHTVVGLKRKPPKSKMPGLYFKQADLTNKADVKNLERDFDLVFYLATPDQSDLTAYKSVYQTGLKHLLDHLYVETEYPQFFFISSTSVYGQTQGEWVDELSAAEPSSATSQLIRQAELAVLAKNNHNVVVRFSGIYGLGRERLLTLAKQQPSIQFEPPYYTNRIHQDDCAAVLAFLMNQSLSGKNLDHYYLASDDDPAPQFEVMTWLAERLQYPPPTIKPVQEPIDQNKRCNNSRLKGLGYQFIYPTYREGYQALIDHQSL